MVKIYKSYLDSSKLEASGCVELLGHVPRLEDLLRLDDDHGAAEQRSARSAAAAVSLTSAEAGLG